ncbi:argininosuccinate lyase [Paeniroseomonas aquatica]|uniref:Argininosuccinate lyase n=1 Tax=Paeniroseomonas aquatica TaxID=373043 RepID=A0ABT8AAW1_9PROT|nr:argininosuccinate lyase [Paeniroseomonas aquatica]MDN3566957.1 argininosuccinate lyase [Paeniroseomonas aquatica]
MAEGEPSLRERVKEPPSALLVESYYRGAVARAQRDVFDHEMWVHLAHGLMLERQGIVARPAIAACLAEVLAMAAEGPAGVPVDFAQEDLYSYVERRIVRALGPDVGGRLHTGRSRNDLNVTSWRMALRAQLLAVQEALLALRGTLLRLAGEHAAVVMPGYTHTQHAQPITFGYWLLSAADALARDQVRLSGALAHADLCPLGAGALTTTAFPLDRMFTTALLGFAAPLEAAYDAVASRDDALEAAAAMAVLMTFLSRLATDLQAWSTWEYGFLELADRHSAVSSIMPQKKNPVALEHARAAAGAVQGALMAALAATKNTAFADVNDAVTAVNEPVLDAALRTRRILALLEEVLAHLALRPARMMAAAAEGFGTATELADVIVREAGLSFRMAHSIVAVVVRDALAAGRQAGAITAADLDAAAEGLFGRRLGIPAAAVAQALDPAENIRSRTVLGGPAPGEMARMLAARDAALARDAAAVVAVQDRIGTARQRCFALAEAMARG